MKYLFYICVSALLFPACTGDFFTQTVEIDPPPYDKQLSFHLALSNQDSMVRLTMTRNYGILESLKNYDDWFVKGASAEIYENGQKWLTLSLLSADSSFELTGALPHPFTAGNTYEIRAEHPDFPKLHAVQIAPGDFQVDSVRVRYNVGTSEFSDQLNLLEVYLQDTKGVKNYYEVTILGRKYQIEYTSNGMDTLGIRPYSLYIDQYSDPNVVSGYDIGGLISDQFFEGQPYKFQARFYADYNSVEDSTITVRIRNVTEDYYNWSRTYYAKLDSEDDPLVEPITVFSNLDNGLGIFAISRQKTFVIKQ